MSATSTWYLATYNAALSLAWLLVLFLTLRELAAPGTRGVWDAIDTPLMVAQTAALLEIVHAATGLVRSPVLVTAVQVFSRINVVWGVLACVPESRAAELPLLHLPARPGGGPHSVSLGLPSLVIAWAATEVIRYGHFACKELGANVYPLLWLRYSTFLVLYPLGVMSELVLIWGAIPHIERAGLFSLSLPNPLNVSFDYAVMMRCCMLAYIPFFPMLYGYMLGQRRRVLGKGEAPKAAKLE